MPNNKTVQKVSKGKKFPLLVYRRYHQVHRGVSLLLIVLGLLVIGIALLVPLDQLRISGEQMTAVFWAGVAITALGLLRFLFTWFVSRMAYVQCTPRNVKIQTPFMPMVFSYKRIVDTRPNAVRDVFPPDKQKGLRHKMLEGLWGETVIVVDLKGYPMSRRMLQIMTGPFLLAPRSTAFVFLVKDWMGLNQQLAQYQEQWRVRTSTSLAPAQRSYYVHR